MKTFVEILQARAQAEPDGCAFAFVARDGSETRLTYGELERRARALAALLQQKDAAGERVLIALDPGLDYVVAVFGCMFAGSIAVPCAPPSKPERAGPLRAIALDSGARFIIGCLPFEDPAFGHLGWIAPDSINAESAVDWFQPAPNPESLALLQYTSGSTASARGVMVSHSNLLENAQVIEEAFQHEKRRWVVTWLPPYHDMGLMGGILQPVFSDAPCAVINPLDFVWRPVVWLETVSRYEARISGGPNFAYELCIRSVRREDCAHLRLDSWRLAYIGAEPVRADTLDQFAAKFAPSGFRRESFFPCYGLAEATLYVTGGRGAVTYLSVAALREHRIVEASEPDASTCAIVSCGRPAPGLKVSIVDPETEVQSEADSVGEVWVSGPTIASGYWNRSEESRGTFQARHSGDRERPFLRTGDLGFMRNGELFVTGRCKDLIIVRGRNHYPQDIESTVAGVSKRIRPGTCAAFSVDSGSEEKLVLALEMPRPRPESLELLGGDIRQAVGRAHELHVSRIVVVPPGAIPRTSSGKLRRLTCRAEYLSGQLRGLATV